MNSRISYIIHGCLNYFLSFHTPIDSYRFQTCSPSRQVSGEMMQLEATYGHTATAKMSVKRQFRAVQQQRDGEILQKCFRKYILKTYSMFSGSTWINLLCKLMKLLMFTTSVPSKEDSICFPLGAIASRWLDAFSSQMLGKKSNQSPSTWKKRNSNSADVNGTWAMPLLGGVNVDCYNSCSCCDGCQ